MGRGKNHNDGGGNKRDVRVTSIGGLGKIIGGIDIARNVDQDQFRQVTPLLETKAVNRDVTGSRSGVVMVDNLNNGVVVLPNRRRSLHREAKVVEDHA